MAYWAAVVTESLIVAKIQRVRETDLYEYMFLHLPCLWNKYCQTKERRLFLLFCMIERQVTCNGSMTNCNSNSLSSFWSATDEYGRSILQEWTDSRWTALADRVSIHQLFSCIRKGDDH